VVSVRAVVAHDELHRGGESLVLLDGQVHRVSPLGTLVRERAGGPVTLEELAVTLQEAFGPPAQGTALDLTREAVQALLDAGLLMLVGD
jgi:hypothetical protein